MEGEIALDHFIKAVRTTPFSQKFREKAKWLMDSFTCFQDEKPQPRVASSARPKKIGDRDMSSEKLTQKTLMTLMNKLTKSNKEHIISQVRNSFRPEFAGMITNTIWDFMLLCPEHQDVYADVLLMLTPHVSEHVQNIWDKYFTNRNWIIQELDTTDYDDFCEHVKLKKRALAEITGFGAFCKKRILNASETIGKLVTVFLHDCDHYINNFRQESMKKLELSLDEFSTALGINMCACGEDVRRYVAVWMDVANSLPPVIRFKIYDINDRCTKK